MRIEDLKIEMSQHGQKTIYKTKFESEGSLSKLIDFLKTDKSPFEEENNISRVVSVDIKGDDEILKVMTTTFPDDIFVRNLIGTDPIHVTYNIAYNDEMLVLKANHPPRLHKLFKFDEILTVTEENGILKFDREAKVFNAGKQIPVFGSSYQTYDDFYNFRNLSYYVALSKICK